MITQRQVDADLQNALDNGYPMLSWTVPQIIEDLIQCCSDYETVSPAELRPFVEEWKRNHTGMTE